MPTESLMDRIGEWNGKEWYWADCQFAKPGPYYWDGRDNVHAGERIRDLESRLAPLERLREAVEAERAFYTLPDWSHIEHPDRVAKRVEAAVDAALAACQSKPDTGEGGVTR